MKRSKYRLAARFALLSLISVPLFGAEPPPFSPQEYKISIKADDPQLQKDTDKLVGDSYVYVVKGQIFDQPVVIEPVSEDQNTFQNPLKVIGRYLAVAPTANKDAILKLYDPDARAYITKTFLSDPAISARWTAAVSHLQGFSAKAIFQEADKLWMVVGYPTMNGKMDKYLMPLGLKEDNGSFMLTASAGLPPKDFMNIQGVLWLKGVEGLTYQVVTTSH